MIALDDLKYAIRLLSKNPGFTILTTLVMAAGIGLSLYLFSFMNTMIFKDLPFKDSNTLVQMSTSLNGVRNSGGINLHDYYEIRTNVSGIAEFGAYKNISVNVSGKEGARRYNAISAEPNIFRLTRTEPILGREFTEAENVAGEENVVVIGYDVWHSRFGEDTQVIDQALRINGVNHKIIGVMPQGYLFPSTAEMWIPMREDATKLARGEAGNYYGIAHLESDVLIPDINRQLNLIMQRIEQRYPKTNKGTSAYVDTFQKAMAGDGIAVVYSMHVAAILILILASINVGNLLLSRSIERSKETAIRVALGAPRSRLISQMLWESIIICSVGGIIGLIVMAWGLEITQAVTETFFVDKPAFWWKFGIDSYTLTLFALFLLSTIIATGLLPAWRNSGADINSVLRDGTRGARGKKAGRLSRFLVNSEIFLSITVLIIAAVIMVGSYLATHADYGADTENILTAEVLLPESDFGTAEQQIEFVNTLQSRLENSVGVGDVMIISALPGEGAYDEKLALEGKEYTQDRGYPEANYIVMTPGSLKKLGVELKEGRYFTSADDGLEKRSAIVTQSFVTRHYPKESPIGKRIRIVESDSDIQDWLTIVGVVEHTIQGTANKASGEAPSVFRPISQAPRNEMKIALKMQAEKPVVIRTLRKTLESIDPELPAFKIETYEENLARGNAALGFISTVFLLFGIAAVILAASGIYGIMSHTINQRTQEIGVKRALGAIEQRITREFLMTGVKHLLWGGIPGLILGSAMGFAMSQVFGTGNSDLLIIAVTLFSIIGSIVVLATWLPTKQALQIGPSEALRYE